MARQWVKTCHHRHDQEVENMAWRPNKYLLEGELENTTPGKVTGWMKFAGLKEKVTFDLEGDFHRDIRGASIRLRSRYGGADAPAISFMDGFALHQRGKAGDITAGLPPADYVDYPYIEWYSDSNGRVVLELDPGQVQLVGTPLPPETTTTISREAQWDNLHDFAFGCACSLAATMETGTQGQPKEPAPSTQLLTEALRKQLPPLYAQEKLGGKALAYAKFFTPDGSWTWYATEFDGRDTFFGLVDGHDKELGYFSLAELANVRGPHGLAIERDIHWTPQPLDQVAPELFRASRRKT
jgi:hypothetical protein